ncbi:MAG: aminopeptidase P family protein [Reyranellaceae bacterium]
MSSPDDGIRHLASRLEGAGKPVSTDDLASLMAGIAAAPEGFAGPTWLELIGGTLDQPTRQALIEARAALAAADHGLQEDTVPPAERLTALRAELRRRGVDGFLVPRSDEYQGEYVPARAQRLAWLTGFTGSAGMAVILQDRAAIFVDGRYTLQVTRQVDVGLFEPQPLDRIRPEAWLGERLKPGMKLAFDPWLHGIAECERLAAGCAAAGAELVPFETNPIDAIWSDQPPAPLGPVTPHDQQFAGETAQAKRQRIAAELTRLKADAAVLSLPDSIAWLLNIRGADVPHVPLPLSFAILHADATVELFIDPRKLTEAARQHLGNQVAIQPQEAIDGALDALGRAARTVLIDPASAPFRIAARLQKAGARLLRGTDPVILPKACKNAVEIEGTRRAHARDGAALTRFLAWLPQAAAGGALTEIAASDRLEALRREHGLCRDLSFDTISGAGPNGAIVHYRATPKSDRTLSAGELYLVDSGAQYPDGTTDVTRTVAIGEPSAEMRDRFTRVLKGHIALATVRFPAGTTGSQLDALARRPLWDVGLDFEHGTGHGVGSFLSVHEGPQRISKHPNAIALRPGMIISNEPGYYKEGGYGIRIENLILVQPADENGRFLRFETLTLAPIDRNLIELSLLTSAERTWIDAYHARVLAEIGPQVDPQTKAWLEKAAAPLAQ